ncbi:MAG: hypothetical protein Q4C01_07980 [Clostridia bacterium]|nr:hypothetical protein [Clostridia bacterium]
MAFACLAAAASVVLIAAQLFDSYSSPPLFIYGIIGISLGSVLLIVAAFLGENIKRLLLLPSSLLFSVPFIYMELEALPADILYLVFYSLPCLAFIVMAIGSLFKSRLITAVGAAVGLLYLGQKLAVNEPNILDYCLVAIAVAAIALVLSALRCCKRTKAPTANERYTR